MMTRRHFIAIADAINTTYHFHKNKEDGKYKEITEEIFKDLTKELVKFFINENERFDCYRFYYACFEEKD